VVRAITPDDKGPLADGYRRLSEESRYRRFLSLATELSDEQLRYLTEIDYWDHFAWVAFLADRPDLGLGVARYIRLRADPDVAEAAITVVDDYQGKGLGTLLLGLLATAALAAGIRTFRAVVLEENEAMRELLDRFGARTTYDSPGLLRLDVPLDPDNVPDTPAGHVLKAVAERALTLSPPVVRPSRRAGPDGTRRTRSPRDR
jgi:RimJ/RimL family protein N-acetyltransferase